MSATPAAAPPVVVVVGAGPVGLTAALLLADLGIAVTVLERQLALHPLPRAVHLDDEVLRVLHRVGVGAAFLARSRPATGLRLLDAERRVLAEFARDTGPGDTGPGDTSRGNTGLGHAGRSDNGYPFANMFHQPDLEALLLARVLDHPLIVVHRGADVVRLERTAGSTIVNAVLDGTARAFPAAAVLGCDGARSTVRDLVGIAMQDLGPTERWLVVDVRSDLPLDTWGGVEQVCDPARAATFMRVVGDRYRWEFQLRGGAGDPPELGRLLRPWTGRDDLEGLEVVRVATYTYRAALARRFGDGHDVFLLGDAAHLTPPFIGQGLGAGIRDAGNLAWKLADVLALRAPAALLATYDAERRPHARALIRKATLVGRAMSSGKGWTARVRAAGLATVAWVPALRSAVASPVTPRLRVHVPRGSVRVRRLLPGSLLPNLRVRAGDGSMVRLDDVIGCGAALLVGRAPDLALLAACRGRGLTVVRLVATGQAATGQATTGQATAGQAVAGQVVAGQVVAGQGWVEVALVDAPSRLTPLLRNPALCLQVRPDRVIVGISLGGLPRPR